MNKQCVKNPQKKSVDCILVDQASRSLFACSASANYVYHYKIEDMHDPVGAA